VRRQTRRVQSDELHAGQSKPTSDRPPCCKGNPATLHLRNNAHIINVLIDIGCLQAKITNAKIATLLAKDGGQTFGTNIVLTVSEEFKASFLLVYITVVY